MFLYFLLLILSFFSPFSSFTTFKNSNSEISGYERNLERGITEEILEFRGSNFYISYPENYSGEKLDLIVFNPGSISVIPNSLSQELPYDVLWFSSEIPKQDFIYVTGNFPGHSASSFGEKDFNLLNDFLENLSERLNFDHNKINFLSYSSGAYYSIYYTNVYPEKVEKLALISPGYNNEDWSDSNLIEKFSDKEIKIWHGENDANIPHQNSVVFYNRFKSLNLEIELVSKQNLTHFDKLLTDKELHQFFIS